MYTYTSEKTVVWKRNEERIHTLDHKNVQDWIKVQIYEKNGVHLTDLIHVLEVLGQPGYEYYSQSHSIYYGKSILDKAVLKFRLCLWMTNT